MKILFLSQIVPYPPHGGVLQRGYNILREIGKNFEVHLLAFLHPDILPSQALIEESRQELGKFCTNIEYFHLWPKKSLFHKYFAFCLGLFSKKPFSVLAHRSKLFQQRLAEILATGEIHIIHFDTIALAQYYNKKMSCPAVMTHHNIESRLMARRSKVEKNTLNKLYLHLQAKRLEQYEMTQSPKFDVNIMMSEIDAGALKQQVPSVITSVIPNGVDTKYFHPRPGHETPAVIYTGGMNMYANKDAVLYFLEKIWPLVKLKRPDATFFAVGQDPPTEIKNISLKDQSIQVTGYVDDIRPYVSKSAVYIVPLRVGGGTRLKVLDAMAMGKAIVSTSIGCEGIEITPGKNILLGDDPVMFAEKTIHLLQNSEKREYFGKAARKLVEEKYSWEIIGKKLQESYKKVVNMKRKSQVIEDEYRFKKTL